MAAESPSPAVAATATPTTANSPLSKLTMSNSPVGWAIGAYTSCLRRGYGRVFAPCPRGNRAAGHCFAWARRTRSSAWRNHPFQAPLPTLRNLSLSHFPSSLFSSSFFSSFLSPYSYSLFPIRHPGEGMAERRQAPGCCEHPVVRAMTGTRAPCFRRPAFPARRTPASRRSTVAILRPGPVLAVVRHSLRDRAPTSFDARVIVTRRTRSRGPPAGVCSSANLTLGQPQASLRISRRL